LKELMGGYVGAIEKRKNWIVFAVTTALLLAALVLVFWGRYNFFRNDLIRAQILGESAMSAWLQLGGGMMGNVIVYLFGVVVSFLFHDPMPGYMEARVEKEKLEHVYDTKRERWVARRNQTHIQHAQKQAEGKRNAEHAQRKESNYTENRALFERLHGKDQEVLAVLGMYRSQLVAEIRNANRNARFHYKDVARSSSMQQITLTPEEYLGQELRLRYS
jgi:hypothetical protein